MPDLPRLVELHVIFQVKNHTSFPIIFMLYLYKTIRVETCIGKLVLAGDMRFHVDLIQRHLSCADTNMGKHLKR